jgi:hypothetical protein
MTELGWYLILAVAFLVLAAWLAREKPPREGADLETEANLAECLFGANCLDLANRIFDPADYRWLQDELCFPQAAALLARDRKDLAIKWLKALRNSFRELVGVGDSEGAENGFANKLSSWQWFGLTVRFQLLLLYALIVVRLFGPYHQLVPRLGRIHSLRSLANHGVRGVVDAERTF